MAFGHSFRGAEDLEREVLPLDVRHCGMRVPIRVNGAEPGWVRLDTGCASALEWVNGNVQRESAPERMAVGLSELSTPVLMAPVRLGSIEFQAVPIGLHAEAIFAGESGLLGNGLLCRFASVTIDAPAGRVVLKKRR